MRIPPGYTEAEVIQIIQEIAKSLSRKFKFDIYSEEDIQQECFFLALPGLEKYDGRRPLRNFLSRHLRNRLINFKRDTMSISAEKHKILGAASLEMEPEDTAKSVLSKLENAELIEYINKNISPELRPDFLRLCDGYSLSHHRKRAIINIVRGLIEEYGERI